MSEIINGDKIEIHERLTRLETNVDTILTNHIPHLQTSLDKLTTKSWAILILLFGNLVGIIVTLILK